MRRVRFGQVSAIGILLVLALALGLVVMLVEHGWFVGIDAPAAAEPRPATVERRAAVPRPRDPVDLRRNAAPGAVRPAGQSATCEIVGVVVDTHGSGIGGIQLVADGDGRGRGRAKAVTDAEGRFRMVDLECGTWLVAPVLEPPQELGDWVGPRGDHGFGAVAVAASGGLLAPRVTLTADEPTGRVRLTLRRGSYVVGHLSASGAPIAGAFVRLSIMPWQIVVNAHTDVAGRFVLPGLVPGSHELGIWLVGSTAAGSHAPPVRRTIDVPEGVRIDLGDLPCLLAERRITGRVVDEGGAAIPGLQVACYPRGTGLSATLARSETDSHGEFDLQGLPALEVSVQVASQDGHQGRERMLESFPPPIDVDLREGKDVRLDTVQATRRRPFVLDVHLASARGAADPIGLNVLYAMIVPGTRSLAEVEQLLQEPDARAPLTWLKIQKAAPGIGRMTWTAARGFEPVTLVIRSSSRHRPVAIIEHVQPVRGQTRELRLTY